MDTFPWDTCTDVSLFSFLFVGTNGTDTNTTFYMSDTASKFGCVHLYLQSQYVGLCECIFICNVYLYGLHVWEVILYMGDRF